MRFCPHCGAPLMAGAKFCVECGKAVGDGATAAGSVSSGKKDAPPKPPSTTGMQLTTAFIVVFMAITILGLGAAAYLYLRPFGASPQPQIASAPPPPPQASTDQASTGDQTTAPTAGGSQSDAQLPPGHPKVELPTEARTFIDKVEKQANDKPDDVDAWVKLGTVSMRAALFDNSYYPKASKAYAHVLKLDPDNPDALRGVGDIDYDQQHYDEAAAAYEHYLKHNPKDPEVITDLGTMYLYTNNADQAVVQYKKAIAIKPDMFQPYYNLGVAYGEQRDKGDAAIAFTKAISLAPDDERKNQAQQAFTKYTGMSADQATKVASTLSAAKRAKSAAASTTASSSGGGFHASFEDMIRNIPFAGPKVSVVNWVETNKAMVMMDHFPMDQMPPFAKDKFLGDLKSGIDSAKAANHVTGTVQVDIVDSQTGHVMQSVTQ
jgi:cytochrome c-type biogenesis protein CcmH/NrfG